MAKCLITGSQGFIGQHLTRELRARGHDVCGCDLMHDADAVAWSIDTDIGQPRYVRCDVAEFRELDRLIDLCGPFTHVYHCAAEFGRHNGEDHYERLWRTNVIGTKHLLTHQREHGFRLIHFSSSEVYGDWPAVMSEDVPDRHVMHPLNDYALSKAVNEQQIRNSSMHHGTESVTVRLFNIYGPGEHYSAYRSALCRFIYCALHGLPMTVYGGHQRSWLYIDDLVRTLANIPDRFKPGAVYNLGNPESLTMEALAALVCECTGASPTLIHREGHEPQTTRLKQVDVSKAVADLGHEVTVSVGEGITATAHWMRRMYHLHEGKEV